MMVYSFLRFCEVLTRPVVANVRTRHLAKMGTDMYFYSISPVLTSFSIAGSSRACCLHSGKNGLAQSECRTVITRY